MNWELKLYGIGNEMKTFIRRCETVGDAYREAYTLANESLAEPVCNVLIYPDAEQDKDCEGCYRVDVWYGNNIPIIEFFDSLGDVERHLAKHWNGYNRVRIFKGWAGHWEEVANYGKKAD